ncbi:MAG: RAD52 family DNA repair protein [Candidatus Roizmanbacteria bacterium]|nr:RAD52 family DNA repair protein [Candidatus Roizmanbacteria bacterium]
MTDTLQTKINQVNALLEKGEPDNVSEDPYTHYKGYSPQATVDAVNEVFGLDGWGFEDIDNSFFDKNENGKPKLAIASVKVWVSGKECYRTAYGQGRITRSDYGDAKKSAQTDALKKAFSYFSIGKRAYLGKL